MSSFDKEYGRWERTCDQMCRRCEGAGELSDYAPGGYGDPQCLVSWECPVCLGSGWKFAYPQDGLRVMRGQRNQWARSRFEGYLTSYRELRAAAMRRTFGWMNYRLRESAIRMGVQGGAAVAAWRAAA